MRASRAPSRPRPRGGGGGGDGGEDGDGEGAGAAATEEAAKAALSNLVGSMGYFYGASLVALPPGTAGAVPAARLAGPPAERGAPVVARYWEDALYTAVPSRSFFPRGFLWDEGFHQLLLQRWDPQLSREALAHWLDLLNAQGWIPREQILGSEAGARVPKEFVTQHPSHANPPSLFLPLLAAAQQLSAPEGGWLGDAGVEPQRAFLAAAWPRLEAWYGWFARTQGGKLAGSYRWHGRDPDARRELNPKTLTSGLDDYPRASHPTDDERHLDLRCWMALASRAMALIGEAVGAPGQRVAHYRAAAEQLADLEALRAHHWDEGAGQFADWGLHTEGVELAKATVTLPSSETKVVTERRVLEQPALRYVPSFGYVSLFPLLMQLLPPGSPDLGGQIARLRDPALLWTPHGLRSLSPTSSLYKKYNTDTDPPYWRGQVWANINFLALRALHHYATTPGPNSAAASEAYTQLRSNLLATLGGGFETSGYLWEQYDDTSGKGMGSHPFTGWSALLTLVAAEAW